MAPSRSPSPKIQVRAAKPADIAALADVLAAAFAEGLPAYLETALERNLRLYERNGFRVVESLDMPRSTVPGWLMRRDPS